MPWESDEWSAYPILPAFKCLEARDLGRYREFSIWNTPILWVNDRWEERIWIGIQEQATRTFRQRVFQSLEPGLPCKNLSMVSWENYVHFWTKMPFMSSPRPSLPSHSSVDISAYQKWLAYKSLLQYLIFCEKQIELLMWKLMRSFQQLLL